MNTNTSMLTPAQREQARVFASLLRTLTPVEAIPVVESYFEALSETVIACAADAIAKQDEAEALDLAGGFFSTQRPRLRNTFDRLRADLRRLPIVGDSLRKLDAIEHAWSTQPSDRPATAWVLMTWFVDHLALYFAAVSAHDDAHAYVLQMLDAMSAEPSSAN